MMVLFMKARKPDPYTGDLFGDGQMALFTRPTSVKGYTRKDGTVVSAHTANMAHAVPKKELATSSKMLHSEAVETKQQERKMKGTEKQISYATDLIATAAGKLAQFEQNYATAKIGDDVAEKMRTGLRAKSAREYIAPRLAFIEAIEAGNFAAAESAMQSFADPDHINSMVEVEGEMATLKAAWVIDQLMQVGNWKD